MAITKWKNKNTFDPWADFDALQSEINKLFNYDRSQRQTGLFDRNFTPAVDVVENDNECTITFEMTGMNKDDIELSVVSNVLTIKGVKKSNTENKNGRYYRKESWEGNFQRSLSLPQGLDNEKISAQLENGFLSIYIPKKEESKNKQITIEVK